MLRTGKRGSFGMIKDQMGIVWQGVEIMWQSEERSTGRLGMI
jgi:hypothetical protein